MSSTDDKRLEELFDEMIREHKRRALLRKDNDLLASLPMTPDEAENELAEIVNADRHQAESADNKLSENVKTEHSNDENNHSAGIIAKILAAPAFYYAVAAVAVVAFGLVFVLSDNDKPMESIAEKTIPDSSEKVILGHTETEQSPEESEQQISIAAETTGKQSDLNKNSNIINVAIPKTIIIAQQEFGFSGRKADTLVGSYDNICRTAMAQFPDYEFENINGELKSKIFHGKDETESFRLVLQKSSTDNEFRLTTEMSEKYGTDSASQEALFIRDSFHKRFLKILGGG